MLECILVLFTVLSVIFCGTCAYMPKEIGKDIYVNISKDQVVDAEYLQKILEEDDRSQSTVIINTDDRDELLKALEIRLKKDPFSYYKKHLGNLINYMKKHDYKISPGTYHFNQAWSFEDGKFVAHKIIGYNVVDCKFKFEKK